MFKHLTLNTKTREAIVFFLLVTLLFVIPMNNTLRSIFSLSSVIAILLTPHYKADIYFSFSQHWGKAAVLFFLLAVIACFWSTADDATKLKFVDKYLKVLYLPIFAVGFKHPKIRTFGIYAFLSAMLVTCLISIIKDAYGYEVPGQIFYNHIMTSFMMVFATYLSCIMAIKNQGKKSILFSLLTLLFSYQILFINSGRSGYILYFILTIMLILQYLPFKYIFAAMLSFCLVFSIFTFQSHVISTRVNDAVMDLKNYEQGHKATSLGYRIMFHQYAKHLFSNSPWVGQGTAGFGAAVKFDRFLPEFKGLQEPHSQYWLIAAEFGLVGLVILFYLFISLSIASFQLNETKPIMKGLLASFFIANLSDSLLLYSTTGYVFIVFAALCLGEKIEKRAAIKDQAGSPDLNHNHPDSIVQFSN